MNKYHNRKVAIDGILFDSKKEAGRYQELLLLQQAGEISRRPYDNSCIYWLWDSIDYYYRRIIDN